MRASEVSDNYMANNNNINNTGSSGNGNSTIHANSTYDVATNANPYNYTANPHKQNMFATPHNSQFSTNFTVRRRPRAEYDPEEYAPRRKMHGQRPVDYYSPAIQHVLTRLLPHKTPYRYHVPPHEYYTKDLLATCHTPFNPSTGLCTQWVNTSFHPDARVSRARIPIYSLAWAPNARRLLCGTSRGEFLLFNEHSFGLEVKTVAHEDNRACRALNWGRRSDLILSGDDNGKLKMWLPSLVLVAEVDTLHRAIREISWSPLELKFCTAGQDGSAKIWDTNNVGSNMISKRDGNAGGGDDNINNTTSSIYDAREEAKLEGHGGEVTTIHWHPFRSIIATGSQDTQIRLWDPRTSMLRGSVASLHGHSNTVNCVRWHPDGQTLLSASRDATVRLWDIRKVQTEQYRFKAHSESVESIAWHPQLDDLFVSTGIDGRVVYWMVNECDGTEIASHKVMEAIKDGAMIEAAHHKFNDKANPIFKLAWSPLGNLLATSSTEVKYWTRNKPGALEEKERGVDDDVLDETNSAEIV